MLCPLQENSAVDPNRLMTYLRWRVQLPVHGGPRSVALQQTRLSAQTLSLQVNILVWVLLLCVDEVSIQCSSNIMSSQQLSMDRGCF